MISVDIGDTGIVDSRDVTREIRRLVWPQLREAGFAAFAGRTAWRYIDDAVDVVNFQSFSASLADAVGCTSFSFSLNLGVWIPGDAWSTPSKRDASGRPRPKEYECEPHRKHLEKTLAQPWFTPFGGSGGGLLSGVRRHREGLKRVFRRDTHDRADIWFVLPDGANLGACLDDALGAIHRDGFAWFAATRSPT